MAQKRMLDKKISVSEQVNDLNFEAQIIFTWAIPHADDLGLLPISKKTLKALIVPMMNIRLEDFGNQVETIVSKNLWSIWKWEGEEFYRINQFLKNQTLKKDRKPYTIAKNIKDWAHVETLGFHLEDNGNLREEKLSKVKLSKVKILTAAELKKNFFENPLMQKAKLTYPDRDYEFQFDLMVDWWQKAKKTLPQSFSAFSNWLKNTKPDELIQAERRRKTERQDFDKKQKILMETPKASDEKLTRMRENMKSIGKLTK